MESKEELPIIESQECLSTEDFVSWLQNKHRDITINVLKVDFNPEVFLAEMEHVAELEIKRSNDGLIAEVIQGYDKNDKSRDSTKFDLHTDGAYYEIPPQFVILHCLNTGSLNIRTIFSDTRKTIEEISTEDVNLLKKLEYYYIGRQGKEYLQPVIEPHFSDRKLISNITAKGYVKPSVTRQMLQELPGMFDYIPAFHRFLSKLEENIPYRHTWNEKDLVIFNNHRFLHGRESEGIDTDRHLYRIWLSLNEL